MLSIVWHKGKALCNECFNKLPEKERGGRGALPVGWSPDDAPKVRCTECKRIGIDCRDEGR